jgi:hypothetical protein
MNNTSEKLKNHIKQSGMIDDMVKYVNNTIPTTIFPNARIERLTINQYLESLEDDSKQRTVLSTGRLSYDGVKFYLSYRANDFFKNYDKADIKILSAKDLDKDSSIKTKSFDVIFSIDGEIIALEIKVTQSNSSFTGATHSTKKVNDYLLISLLVDRDTIVEETKQYVKGVFAMMVNLQQNEWNGKAKKNSSWTSLKFKSNKNYDDNLICGGLIKKRTNMEIVFKSL